MKYAFGFKGSIGSHPSSNDQKEPQSTDHSLETPNRIGSRFLWPVHVYRAAAIFLVLCAHSAILFQPNHVNTSSTLLLATLISGGTISFVFISGFLFQHLAARFDYREYLIRKFHNVLLPYVFASAPIILHQFVFSYGIFEGRTESTWAELMLFLIVGLVRADHCFIPFWFISTIALIYLLAPMLLALDRRPHLYVWALIALIPLGSLIHRSWLYADPIQNAIHLLPVYILGMGISRLGKEAMDLYERYSAWLLLSVLALIAIEVNQGHGGHIMSAPFAFDHGVVDWNYLQKILFSVWLYGFLHRSYRYLSEWQLVHAALFRIADISFGIFFLHIYLNIFLLPRAFDFPELSWIGFFVVTPMYFALAIFLTELAKWVAGRHSRRLIGC